MGKYFLAWLLGVPMFVLVLIYLFFHWSDSRAPNVWQRFWVWTGRCSV